MFKNYLVGKGIAGFFHRVKVYIGGFGEVYTKIILILELFGLAQIFTAVIC